MTQADAPRFSRETEAMLREGGWFPGRDVTNILKLPEGFAIARHPHAHAILKEFAYLEIGHSRPGIAVAQSTIHFDPMLALGEDDRLADYTRVMHRHFYPLGMVDGGYYHLTIDEVGWVFLMMDHCWFVDTTFEAALDRLLTGKVARLVNDEGIW
jgi:SUKH-3 immunity protein